MSADQSTSQKTGEPRLCRMGCGFFGSGATDGCCSKCFLDMQKNRADAAAPPQAKREEPQPPQPDEKAVEEEAQPMDVETTTTTTADAPSVAAVEQPVAVAAPEIKKKKKKKASYKAMMAAMTQSTGTRDVEKEKESIRKATGGGAFSKIDKI